MRRALQKIWNVFMKGDLILLLLCVVASAFGCLCIASATNHHETIRYVIVQAAAIVLGVMCYVAVSAIDLDFVSEHRGVLVVFNIFLLLLLIPFGVDFNSGNKSWLDLPLMPVSIQPAEICKITFVLILASVMASHQQRISSVKSVFSMLFHMLLLVGTNIVISKDAGVSLIFVFIFIGMAFAGGVSMFWFVLGGGAIAAGAPVIWNFVMSERQRKRFEVLWNPDIDPMGLNERYHSMRSLKSLTGGGLTGQGLFNGNRTQIGALPAQHTDYIFSAIGEEMGYIGCIVVLILLLAIVVRVVQVGSRSQNYLRRMVCFGSAMALIFQICSNVGMCIGVTPVIGLTLPFISYGGSSIVSLYAMLGLVSGVKARPAPKRRELYVRPY
ncbi:MAG: FtsW/RodA/SpoVE family cell cycle protein [Oscillospiraceae bacterium]|nr:FtsW/RodA/SpoVE family cell cycle protein [Oscillospiraceae bacterium]